MKKIFTLIALAALATSAKAETPYKNLYATAETVPSVAGIVYIDAKDDGDKAFVKEINDDYDTTATFKAVLGENGSGDDGELDAFGGKKGTYEAKVYAEPADGYEFVCFSSVDKSSDPNAVYTYAECYKPFSGASQQDRVYDWNLNASAADGVLININNVNHEKDGDSENGPKREDLLANGPWSETPDTYIYVIFRKTGDQFPALVDGESTAVKGIETAVNADDAVYTVGGLKAEDSTKGVLIKNGKKILNK